MGSGGETRDNAPAPAGQSTETGGALDPPRDISIWQYATFLLGLVPAAVAILRVVLVARGDDATFYTLVRTLDVPALVIATYGRFVGVLGVGVALPLLLYSRGKRKNGTWSIRLDPPSRIILWILLACSVACIYPEEIFDYTRISIWPVDIFRALGWAFAVYLPARLWLMCKNGRKPQEKLLDLIAGPFSLIRARCPRAAGRFDRGAALITGHLAETWVIAPALVLLLWSYLLGNDRMWLPAQIVSVHATAAIKLDAPPLASRPSDLQAGLLPNGDLAFVAYVLDEDSSGFTLITVTGRIVNVPAADLTGQVPCQFEADYDPRYDEPLLFFVPGHGELPRSANPTCQQWMDTLTRN